MADEELIIDIPEKDESKAVKKKRSSPFKQSVASVADLFTDLPNIGGLLAAGAETGISYLTDPSDKSFIERFVEASSSGIDKTLFDAAHAGRTATNKFLGISEPQSAKDILARNSALFLPIPGLRLAKGASRLAKIARGTTDVLLPTVKHGPLPNMIGRGLVQGDIGLGIDQGLRALSDDPEKLPLLFSDMEETNEIVNRPPSPLLRTLQEQMNSGK